MTNTSPLDHYPPAWMPEVVTMIRRLRESDDSEPAEVATQKTLTVGCPLGMAGQRSGSA